MDQKEEVENLNKFNLANLNLKQNRKSETTSKKTRTAGEVNKFESEDEKEADEAGK